MSAAIPAPAGGPYAGPYVDALVVRRSPINGRGVYTTAELPGRRKLGELSGTLVRLPQAMREAVDRKKIYLVQVSQRYALDCSAGNRLRFLNHSCAANCYLRVYRRRVEVYTRIGIPAGAELTVDYGATPHRRGMACRCGAPGCRGRL